jgi:dTDP-4-amino-4,6-dideoxy-D-galactose acyltransferase
MINIKKLAWDTAFFGFPIARIETDEAADNNLKMQLAQLLQEGTELVYVLSSSIINDDFWQSTDFDISDVGGKLLYHKKLTDRMPYHPQIESYRADTVSEKLYELAIQSGIYSRFKLDSKLPGNAYERLYRIWIENSVNRSIAEEVFVFKQDDKIAGMITLSQKEDWGDIGLIAVDHGFRGQKIGQNLLAAANTFFFDKGLKDLGVETQTINSGACRFYEANGFLVHKTEYLYHCRQKSSQ